MDFYLIFVKLIKLWCHICSFHSNHFVYKQNNICQIYKCLEQNKSWDIWIYNYEHTKDVYFLL